MPERPTRTGFSFAALMTIAPAAAVGGGMLMAPLQALAGIVGARAVLATLRAAWPLLLFAAWTAVTLAWSPVARPEQVAKIAAAVITGVLLIGAMHRAAPPDRRLARAALVAAVIVLIAYSAIEAGFGMPLNRLDEPNTDPGILERNPGKGVSILVALLWAAIGALLAGGGRWRAVLAAALAVGAGALSLQFHMATNAFGFVAGALAFALAWTFPRWAPLAAAGLAAGWLLAAPLLAPLIFRLPLAESLPLSWRMRGRIWDFAIARAQEKPLQGWGLDGGRAFGDTIETIDDLPFRVIPLHPHSFSLHVWLETGLIGVLLMAGAFVWGGWLASRALAESRPAAAALTATIVSIAAIWNVSYGAWQEWWMASAFVALAGAVAARR